MTAGHQNYENLNLQQLQKERELYFESADEIKVGFEEFKEKFKWIDNVWVYKNGSKIIKGFLKLLEIRLI